MRREHMITLVAIAGLGVPATAIAQEGGDFTPPLLPSEAGTWYYEIGGATPVMPPPNPQVETLRLGFEAGGGLGYSCGAFDPVQTIQNHMERSADPNELVATVMGGVEAAAAAAPAVILQRANPGLYDFLQNSLIRAEEAFELATKTCQEMEAELADGIDPYQELVTLSKGDDWRVAMGSGGDIIQAQEEIEENPGSNGIEWLGGARAGGEDQEPINTVSDVVRAGYNVTLGRSPNAGTPAAESTPISRTWASPQEAEEWSERVLGDKHIHTCNSAGCETETTPGMGLLPVIQDRNQDTAEELAELVWGNTSLTSDNLQAVSAPGIGVTEEVIQALRELPEQDRTIATGRLAQEVATAQVMEEALMMRRALLTGRNVPEISRSPIGQEHSREAINELEREIEILMLESEARQAVVSNTAGQLVRELEQRKQESFGTPAPDPAPAQRFIQGVPMELEE